MKVVVIEDDINKSKQLVSFARRLWPAITVAECRSFQSGLREILFGAPALVLLDMAMPTYDVSGTERGGRWRFFAGRDILRQMRRKGVTTPVIVVTQFETFGEEKKTLEQLASELVEEFPSHYLGTVYYHPAELSWQESLREAMSRVLGGPVQGAE